MGVLDEVAELNIFSVIFNALLHELSDHGPVVLLLEDLLDQVDSALQEVALTLITSVGHILEVLLEVLSEDLLL